jgi:hypothetical protein
LCTRFIHYAAYHTVQRIDFAEHSAFSDTTKGRITGTYTEIVNGGRYEGCSGARAGCCGRGFAACVTTTNDYYIVWPEIVSEKNIQEV